MGSKIQDVAKEGIPQGLKPLDPVRERDPRLKPRGTQMPWLNDTQTPRRDDTQMPWLDDTQTLRLDDTRMLRPDDTQMHSLDDTQMLRLDDTQMHSLDDTQMDWLGDTQMPRRDTHVRIEDELRELAEDARVTVRRGGEPWAEGECVVYWMQRAERGRDNHALDLAVRVGNLLELPVVVYFAGIANFPGANLRHYAFLNRGLWDVEEDLAERNIGFVLRNAPHESHERFLADVKAAFLVGDENPMREPERWRKDLAERIEIPFWTVDADVVVPSKLMEKAQYGAYTIRPRLMRMMPEFTGCV